MATIIRDCYEFFIRRIYLISWISLVVYTFYTTFIFYKTSPQFYYLREILGIGLCISRGTATVLNICCALVLLPLCKKLNQVLYRILSKVWPGLFFFWLEKAKSFHMTVAVTLVLFAVTHSISHFVNLWNFSRNYDEKRKEINFASYKNENPFWLLMSPAGLTGAAMLSITLGMGLTSLRVVRRRLYNAFWYTHQLYMPFMALLIVHPLSGVLKMQLLPENRLNFVYENEDMNNSTDHSPVFIPIQSKTWVWMSLPLSCFFLDLLWRIFSRNRVRVDITQVTHMAGRTLSLTLSHKHFRCRAGQYVLLQCLDVSRLEWHPYTVVKVPTSSQRNFIVWIRVKGDWTAALERLLLERGPKNVNILVDGPFSSPLEEARGSRVAVCVAAGVGITPFVPLLHDMLLNPRSRLPGRIHLLWIVRHERELTWLAELATKTLLELRNANRPDRLQLELYVTNTVENHNINKAAHATHVVVIDEKGSLTHVVTNDDEKVTLLTPNRKRRDYLRNDMRERVNEDYSIAKEFPHLACRVRRGRPHWDRLFGYWVHLYPEYSQDMNNIFKEYFLVQNLAVTLELCLNALMATMIGFEQKTLLATFFAFLCVALLNAYIYCYLGNEMISQSEDLALAAYESSWTSWPLDMQKDLLILLRAAQKPLQLSAGGMVAMSIQTYSQTLYNGYSIFAVLNDVVA